MSNLPKYGIARKPPLLSLGTRLLQSFELFDLDDFPPDKLGLFFRLAFLAFEVADRIGIDLDTRHDHSKKLVSRLSLALEKPGSPSPKQKALQGILRMTLVCGCPTVILTALARY